MSKKRWTPNEDAKLLELYQSIRSRFPDDTQHLVFETLQTDPMFQNRTPKALEWRWSMLTRDSNQSDEAFAGFIESLEMLKVNYKALMQENVLLKKKILQLEQQAEDYEQLTAILNRAKAIVKQDLEITEEPQRFKMEDNGNLTRY